MRDMTPTAAGVTVPADCPICPGLGVDLIFETTKTFGTQVIDPFEVGFVGHDGC